MRPDTILNMNSEVLFKGPTDDAVIWLEMDTGQRPLWVCIGETGDIITASQYLDLASENDDIILDRDTDGPVPWYLTD